MGMGQDGMQGTTRPQKDKEMRRLGDGETRKKFQITNSKSEIDFKSQFQMTKTILQKQGMKFLLPLWNSDHLFENSDFGHWDLFVVWCLGFGV